MVSGRGAVLLTSETQAYSKAISNSLFSPVLHRIKLSSLVHPSHEGGGVHEELVMDYSLLNVDPGYYLAAAKKLRIYNEPEPWHVALSIPALEVGMNCIKAWIGNFWFIKAASQRH